MIDELMLRFRPVTELAAHAASRTSTLRFNSVKEIQP